MASGGARPDLEALRELEEVLRHLESELANWRRRALSAEARASELSQTLNGGGDSSTRADQLEEQNRQLEERVEQARSRVSDLLSRLTFMEQQSGNGGPDQ